MAREGKRLSEISSGNLFPAARGFCEVRRGARERVTTKENYLLESRQCVVLGPRLLPSPPQTPSLNIAILSVLSRVSFLSLSSEIFPSVSLPTE